MHRNTSPRSHLKISDIFLVGISGLLTRKVRATLSALGITIGIAAVVGVLGLSESGNADLMRELDSLGTNLLTVEAGQSFGQEQAELPKTATSMVKRIGPVYEVASVSRVPGKVLRNEYVDTGRTQGITIFATDLNLLNAQKGELASGTFLQEATSHFPNVVLGSVAAERLGISQEGVGIIERPERLFIFGIGLLIGEIMNDVETIITFVVAFLAILGNLTVIQRMSHFWGEVKDE